MTTLLDHGPVDASATVLIIHGDQLLMVGADADGLGPLDDLLPPEYAGRQPVEPPRLPRVRRYAAQRTSVTEGDAPPSTVGDSERRVVATSSLRGNVGHAGPSGEGLDNRTGTEPDEAVASEHQRFADRRASIEGDQRRARRRRRGRLVLGSLTLVCGSIGLLASPVLRVQDVHIVGISALNRDAVLSSMAIGDHPSMLGLRTVDIEKRLTAIPLISSASVWKEWPNTLVVEISERSAVAAIRSNGGWLVIDQHGGVLETRTVRPDLPLLDLGGRTVDQSSKDLSPLLAVASGASARLRQQIDVLAIEGDGVTVRMRNGSLSEAGTTVRIGHADDVDAKLRALETMIDESTAVSFDGIATLDLTVADQPALIKKPVPTTVVEAGAEAGTDAGSTSAGPANGTLPNSSSAQ